jgi:hypothetical protein
MPTIILKKTFKIKPSGFQVATEKSFSFHGGAVTPDLVATVNQGLMGLNYVKSANKVQFVLDPQRHYYASMNHDCQKHHEEDIVTCIMDVMEVMGWTFRYQYDSESQSIQALGSSATSRELFMFQNNSSNSC